MSDIKNESSVKERLVTFIKFKGISNLKFEKICGLPNSTIQNIRKSIDPKTFDEKIAPNFPELNKYWLLFGDGEMLNSTDIVKPTSEIVSLGRNKKKQTGLIPFYNADFIAGDAELYYEDATIYPEYYLDVPEFSGCTAFRAFSDSMEKLIRPGSTLFGTKVEDWVSHLEYGQIYGITCTDGRRYLKYIRKDREDPKNHFLLKSENEQYDDFSMPKNKIKNIWLIEGWINKTT